jgi:hypothetical protein
MRTKFLAACLLPLVLVSAAGCAKSTDGKGVASVGGTATPSATPSLSLLEQAVRYARCMRQHGVPMPDPVVNGDSIQYGNTDKTAADPDTTNRAEQACNQYAPVLSASDVTQKTEAARQEAQCMREHGVEDFPDPVIANGRPQLQVPQSVHQDPQYDQAKAACDAREASARPKS